MLKISSQRQKISTLTPNYMRQVSLLPVSTVSALQHSITRHRRHLSHSKGNGTSISTGNFLLNTYAILDFLLDMRSPWRKRAQKCMIWKK